MALDGLGERSRKISSAKVVCAISKDQETSKKKTLDSVCELACPQAGSWSQRANNSAMNTWTKSKTFRPAATYLTTLLLAIFLAGCGGGSGDDFSTVPVPNPVPSTGNPTLLLAAVDSYETTEDLFLQVDELFGVLSNDEYPIYDTVIEYPFYTDQGGELDGYQNGSFDYQPPAGFTGQDTFTYTLTDDLGRTSSAQVFITVYPIDFRVAEES